MGRPYCPNRKKSQSLLRNKIFAIISQKNGSKPSQSSPSLKNDKGSKLKGKKTERHCDFCGKDNHDESICFKKMAALEAVMKKHHISLDLSSESNSHGQALFAYVYPY